MIKKILQQSLIISGTRLIALSMPMIDMIMLGRQTTEDVANFTIANQIIQIFVVLIISLSVGINVIVPKKNIKSSDINHIIGFSVLIGLIITFISILLGFYFLRENASSIVYYILASGLLPLSIFVGISSIMEAKGYKNSTYHYNNNVFFKCSFKLHFYKNTPNRCIKFCIIRYNDTSIFILFHYSCDGI